jgi:drug/metabolite transporter (DMT)-like permease
VILLPLGDALVLTSFTPLIVAVLSPVLIGEIPSRYALLRSRVSEP